MLAKTKDRARCRVCCRYLLFQKRAEYQAALVLPVPQSRPDDQILRCCAQQQARMRQVCGQIPHRVDSGLFCGIIHCGLCVHHAS